MGTTAFDSGQFQDAYPEGIERSWWHVARNRIIARAFDKHIHKGTRVLEVGCGTGIVTRALRSRGWDVTGVDLGGPSLGAQRDEHLILGMDALRLPSELRTSFQAIALFDTIEHISDAPAFLRSLLDAYPKVSQVVITVPARKELWTTFDDHYGHFRRYDRPMLRDELAQAGLAAERIAYFFHGVHPAIFVNNLIRGRQRDLRFKAPAPGMSSLLNKAVGACFALEDRVLPDALIGSSIIAVARRARPGRPDQ